MGCKAFAFQRLPGLRSAVGALAVGRMVSVGILLRGAQLGERGRACQRQKRNGAFSAPKWRRSIPAACYKSSDELHV